MLQNPKHPQFHDRKYHNVTILGNKLINSSDTIPLTGQCNFGGTSCQFGRRYLGTDATVNLDLL